MTRARSGERRARAVTEPTRVGRPSYLPFGRTAPVTVTALRPRSRGKTVSVGFWQEGQGTIRSIVPRTPAALAEVILSSALHELQRMRLVYGAMGEAIASIRQ